MATKNITELPAASAVTGADAIPLMQNGVTKRATPDQFPLGQQQQTAVTTLIQSAITALIGGAPGAVDTLKEIADAIGSDPTFVTTISASLANKEPAGLSNQTQAALAATYFALWKPNTQYATNAYVLNPSGQVVSSKASFTSSTTYNSANWNLISAGGGSSFLPGTTNTITTTGALAAGSTNLVDATSGPLTATLPTPTSAGQLLIVERADATTNLITIGGTVRGLTSAVTLPGLGVSGESILFESESSTSWRIVASHKPKSLLDKQFAPVSAAAPSRMPTFDQPPGSLLLEAAPATLSVLTGDDFSGTAATTLSGRASTLGTPGTWTVRSGTWQIDGSNGVSPTTATDGYIATLPIHNTYRSNGTAQVTTTYKGASGGAANIPGLIIRYVDTSNYWFFAAVPSSAAFVLYQVKAGTTRVMATVATPSSITDGTAITLRVDWLGRDITCYVNNIELYCFVSADVGMNTAVIGIRQGIAASYATPVKFSNLRITNHMGPKWNFPRVDAAPGVLIAQPGVAGTWDNADINNPNVVWDPNNQQWTIYYSGYDGVTPVGQGLGLITAPTLSGPWTKDPTNPIVPGTGNTSNGENGGLVWVFGRWLRAQAVGNGVGLFTSPDLRTWTPVTTVGLPSSNMYDAFLRVTHTGQLEIWYGSGYPNAKIYRASSVDGGTTWTVPVAILNNPPYFTWNSFRGNGEPSVFSVPGTADREMIIFADGGEIDGKGFIVAAFTIDAGATWHWRNVAGGSGFGFDSYQKFDSYPIYAEGAFHLFYGATAVNGNSLNIGIGIGRMSVQWSPNPSAISNAAVPYGLADPASAAPANTTVPTFSGSPALGSTLSATTGTWTNNPTRYVYQWYRGSQGIPGATSATYAPVVADIGATVTVTVVAFKDGYASNPATSSGVTVGIITNTAAPTFTGTLRVGQVLTATTGSWSPAPTSFTYQWNRNGAPISGATAQTYTPVTADLNMVVTVTVTAALTNYNPTPATSPGSTINSTGLMHDPTTVSGLIGRYRADSVTGTASGSAFTTWPDSSGSNYNATAPDAPSSPIYIASGINGRPTIRFAAVAGQTYAGKMLNSSLPAGGTTQTIIAVMQTPTSATARVIRSSPSNNGLEFRINSAGKMELLQRGTASIGADATNVPSTPVVVSARYAVTGGPYSFTTNGTAGSSGTVSRAMTATTSSIGTDPTFGEPFVGDISELLVFNKVLSGTELAVVDSYVQDYYGIVVTDYS